MITLYTIGFTKKSAEQFFTLLEKSKVKKLVDVRISNSSQLAGFAKGRDLEYFANCYTSPTNMFSTLPRPRSCLTNGIIKK